MIESNDGYDKNTWEVLTPWSGEDGENYKYYHSVRTAKC